MSPTHLSLAQAATALERYDGKYQAFDVFADDIEELYALGNAEPLSDELNVAIDDGDLLFSAHGKRYRLALAPQSGMARITRADGARSELVRPTSDFKGLGRLTGSAMAHAISTKGEGWLPKLFIGVLTMRARGQPDERTITVRYDVPSGQWRAYGGPMSQWLRQAAAS
jgi:hypothetical protein